MILAVLILLILGGCDNFYKDRTIQVPEPIDKEKTTYVFKGDQAYRFDKDITLVIRSMIPDTVKILSNAVVYHDSIRIHDSTAIHWITKEVWDSSAIKTVGQFFKLIRDYK